MSDTITERVTAGAAFLDEKHPNWWDHIDLSQLRIESCFKCVLGQIFGQFGDGADELHLSAIDEDDVALGFYWSDADAADPDAEIAGLNAEWKRVITERRAAA